MNNQTQGMPCPIDGTQLVMSERQGIEIDYCPSCRGVWLDRGELDKILQRSSTDQGAGVQAVPHPAHHHSPHGYKKRRKSLLEELFD